MCIAILLEDRAHQRIRGKTGVVDVQSKYDVIKIGQL